MPGNICEYSNSLLIQVAVPGQSDSENEFLGQNGHSCDRGSKIFFGAVLYIRSNFCRMLPHIKR